MTSSDSCLGFIGGVQIFCLGLLAGYATESIRRIIIWRVPCCQAINMCDTMPHRVFVQIIVLTGFCVGFLPQRGDSATFIGFSIITKPNRSVQILAMRYPNTPLIRQRITVATEQQKRQRKQKRMFPLAFMVCSRFVPELRVR